MEVQRIEVRRGVKRRRDDKRTNDVRTSPALGLQSADEDIIKAEVTTGEGHKTAKPQFG